MESSIVWDAAIINVAPSQVAPGSVVVGPSSVVLYYEGSCGFCRHFAPIFNRLPAALVDAGIRATVCVVDVQCHHLPTTTMVPTIVFVTAQGTAHTHEGPLLIDDIVTFVRAKSAGGTDEVKSQVSQLVRDWFEEETVPDQVARWCDIPVTCPACEALRHLRDEDAHVKSLEYARDPSYKVVPLDATFDEVRIPLKRQGDVLAQVSVTFRQKRRVGIRFEGATIVFATAGKEHRVPIAPWSRLVGNTVTIDLGAAPLPSTLLQFVDVEVAFRVPAARKVTVGEEAITSLATTSVWLQHEERSKLATTPTYPFHNVVFADGIVANDTHASDKDTGASASTI